MWTNALSPQAVLTEGAVGGGQRPFTPSVGRLPPPGGCAPPALVLAQKGNGCASPTCIMSDHSPAAPRGRAQVPKGKQTFLPPRSPRSLALLGTGCTGTGRDLALRTHPGLGCSPGEPPFPATHLLSPDVLPDPLEKRCPLSPCRHLPLHDGEAPVSRLPRCCARLKGAGAHRVLT